MSPAKKSRSKRAFARRYPDWLLALVGFVGVPLTLLCALELALRVAGFGYPTRFFLSDGESYRENPSALWRYMPREMARSPAPLRVAKKKGANEVRVVVFGESAALGDPDPAFGFARFLEVLLEDRFPELNVATAQTAAPAINSHVIRDIAHDARRLKGDYWLLLMGNNEFLGPYGPVSIFGREKSSVGAIRLSGHVRQFKVGQAMERLMAAVGPKPDAEFWDGLRMFEDQSVHPDSGAAEWVARAYETNLRAILEDAKRSGARTIVARTPVNLANCAPFADGEPGVSKTQTFAESHQSLANGDFEAALSGFQKLTASYSRSSEAWWGLGSTYLAMGDSERAAFPLRHARNLDALPLRTTQRLNQVAQSITEEALSDGALVEWLDPVPTILETVGESILGRKSFYEHAHFTTEGNYGLALAFADAVARSLVKEGRKADSEAWLSYEDCAAALGLSDWVERGLWASMRQRLLESPMNRRRNNPAAIRYFDQKIRELGASEPEDALATLIQALEARPDDWLMLRHRALTRAAVGQAASALEDIQSALELMPTSPVLSYQAGKLTLEVNPEAYDAARRYFESALRLRPSFAEARLEIAFIDQDQGDPQAALSGFEEAVGLDPSLVSAREALIRVYMEMERPELAISAFRALLERSPRATRLSRSLLDAEATRDGALSALMKAGMKPGEGTEALRISARWLREQGRAEEAIAWLATYLSKNSNDIDAGYQFCLSLITAGRLQEAIEPLEQVCELRPQFGSAWFNLGVIYAKLDRKDEALAAFEAVPDDDPNAQMAMQYAIQLQLD